MTTYPIELSTTEPNWVGLIKIRQGDTESQVFDITITENGVPVDFTGLTPFFCVKSSPRTGLGFSEQKVINGIDAKNGRLSYTLTDYDMQAIQLNKAYFSFRKLAEDLTWRQQFSTKDFAYSVVPSIYSDGIKDSNYIWTFEEILRYFHEWVEESMKTYDDWYIKAQEELQRIILEFQGWIGESQASYDKWISENKSDFVNWMEANKEGFGEWFDYVKSILDENAASNLLNQLDEIRPSQELIELQHDFKGYPKARVLYWEYGLATRSLENEPLGLGGSTSFTVEHEIEYLDRDKLKIRVPMKYKLASPEVIFIDNKTVRLIADYRIIQVEFLESDINIYQDLTETIVLDFKDKAAGSKVENPNAAYAANSSTLVVPSALATEFSNARYKQVSELDDSLVIVTGSSIAAVAQEVFVFDVISAIEQKAPHAMNKNLTVAEKYARLKEIIQDYTMNVYGFGAGNAGNELNMRSWNGSSWSNLGKHTKSVVTKLSYSAGTNFSWLQSNGEVNILAYTSAASDTVASTTNIDYASVEVTIKYRKEAV